MIFFYKMTIDNFLSYYNKDIVRQKMILKKDNKKGLGKPNCLFVINKTSLKIYFCDTLHNIF